MKHSTQTPTSSLPLIITAVLLLVTGLVACQPASEDGPFTVADIFVTPGKSLATAELEPTPTATTLGLENPPAGEGDGIPEPLPTVVVLPQPTMPLGTPGPSPTPFIPPSPTPRAESTALATPVDCSGNPPPPFSDPWQSNNTIKATLGCHISAPEQHSGVVQEFENGWMFWRESDRSIYAVANTQASPSGLPAGRWWRVTDTYADGEPDSDPSLQPPAGLSQPIRGFGKAWRDNAFIRDALGWARGVEYPVTAQWLEFEGGWMLTGPDGVSMYALVKEGSAPYNSGIHYGAMQ